MKKSDEERFRMGFEMADLGQRMVEEQFRQQCPDWSIGQRKAAVFERIYRNDFSVAEMIRIKAAIMNFYQNVKKA
ncbi:hypothetical protein [Spirosoma koreense]